MTDFNGQNDLIEDGGLSDLKGRTVRGGAVIFTMQIMQQLLRLGLMAILARILTPEDYGLIGMVTAITALLEIFSDFGLSMATIQKPGLTRAQISTMFWINLALGLLLTCIAAAGAPAISWFYKEPVLLFVTLLSSAGFTFASAGVQHRALLARRMQFGRLGMSAFFGILAGGMVGIWMALNDYGVYALVGQSLTLQFTKTLSNWILSRWIPGLPVRGSGVREMLRFGGYLTAHNILVYFSRNVDRILLGRFWGAAEVGLYTRAYMLMRYPITIVSGPMGKVMVPALSKLENDKKRYTDAYIKTMRVLALLSFPVGCGLALLAEEVITIIYGSQWTGAIPIFRILCFVGIFQAWKNSQGWLFITAGKTRELFMWAMISCTVVVIGFLPCIWYGGVGAAAGYAAAQLLFNMPVGFWYATRTAGLPFKPLVKVAAGPLAASILMSAVVLPLKFYVTADMEMLPKLLVLIPAGALTFLIGVLVFARSSMKEAISVIKVFLKPKINESAEEE